MEERGGVGANVYIDIMAGGGKSTKEVAVTVWMDRRHMHEQEDSPGKINPTRVALAKLSDGNYEYYMRYHPVLSSLSSTLNSCTKVQG